MNKQFTIGAALLLFGTGIVGCSNTAEGAKEDAGNAGAAVQQGAEKSVAAVDNGAKAVGDNVKKAGDQTVAAAKDAGVAVQQGAEKAGTAVKQGAENAGAAVQQGTEKAVAGTEKAVAGTAAAVANVGEAAAITPKITTALDADPEIKQHQNAVINVDTKNGKVILRGQVKTNDLKKKAETITRKTLDADKYTNTIVNQLTVGIH